MPEGAGASATPSAASVPDAPLLVEPLGLLTGAAAAHALATGAALPFRGGPVAFPLVRLLGGDGAGRVVPATAVPAAWATPLARATALPSPFAGLPAGRPAVMGILNATPDSFSDGGRHLDPAAAIAAGLAMRAAGADVLDVGGESTRPGAEPVASDEELARVLPVVRALAAGGPVSVDTRHAATMRACLDAGAALVNDVTALRHDPAAAGVVAASARPVVLMHMPGTDPRAMQALAAYGDVAAEVAGFLAARVAALEALGVPRARIALDPGIGFGKTCAHNLALLERLPLLASLGCAVLVGASRKRFVGELSGEPVATRRLGGSVAAALAAADGGAAIVRVHDVAETVQALRIWRACRGGAAAAS